jgi:hypothetical protein
MARKTDKQIADERLGELRVQLGKEQDKLEELERGYNANVSILEGKELAEIEEAITAQRYIVKQVNQKIEEIKNLKDEYTADQQEANSYKWKEVEPLLLQAIEDNHVSYNVLSNKYIFCKDMGDNTRGVINPVFQNFEGTRATTAFSKMIDKYLFDANLNIQKLFITRNKTHYQETASFLTAKWTPANVYNKASVIRKFWLEPVFEQAYDPDLDMLIYCVAGGKQENIEHLEKWIAYKYFWPERSANTPNLDLGGSPGGNGKTILIEMMKTIFTPNCVVPAVAKELKDGFNASWELAVILHFDEPEEKELPASKMKNATGGVEQRVERKGVDAYSSDRNYSIVATSNNPLGVFKLAGSGTSGEDRRYSVMNTDKPLVDEAMERYGIEEDAARAVISVLASKKIRDREDVARWLGAQILKHNIPAIDMLPPLHGADYQQRFEDQKSSWDTIFDQVLPAMRTCGVISVVVLRDIIGYVTEPKTLPTPQSIKKAFKAYLTRNRITFEEAKQQRVDVSFAGKIWSTHQAVVFRTDPNAKQFDWDLVCTKRPNSDIVKDDMLIAV